MLKKVRPVLKKHRVFKRAILWSISLSCSVVVVSFCYLVIFPQLPLPVGWLRQWQAYAQSSRHIVEVALWDRDVLTQGADAHEIVSKIVNARTKNDYLFTGGHYIDLYPRNLGTFANKLVEHGAAINAEEWLDRVEMMVRTTKLSLEVFDEYDQMTTTIVRLNGREYVPINIYAPPSDTLASVLRVAVQVRDLASTNLYEMTDEQKLRLKNLQQEMARAVEEHRVFLIAACERFVQENVDEEGFIRKDVDLSGIKDTWIRHSAFYDNVMLWGVYEYASELGIKYEWSDQADDFKHKLLERYWNEQVGIFYDENPAYVKEPYLSADVLIAFDFGMLGTMLEHERKYGERLVEYVRSRQMDQPLALRGTEKRIPGKEHLPVRMFAPNYWGTTIWSYWGMVYIGLLEDLGEEEDARQQLENYTKRIEAYQGFPELYGPDGAPYRTTFYRSVNDMVWGIYYLYLENKIVGE